MSNVPGMDRARRARGTPQMRRRRGGPRGMEHPHKRLLTHAKTGAFDGPAISGFRWKSRIHGSD
jgi:hypothetical protein